MAKRVGKYKVSEQLHSLFTKDANTYTVGSLAIDTDKLVVTEGGGACVGSTTNPGDNNLRVEGTLTQQGVATFAAASVHSLGLTATAGNITATDGNMVITAADHGIIHTNSGTVTQGTNATTAVTLNTTSGIITTYAATLATNTEVEFTLNNSTIQADSIILVSMNDENVDANSHILVTTNTITGGSCKINLFNCGSGTASATACHIHFLVINNS